MSASARQNPPGGLAGQLLDWRADRINDPVEKLRFLRRTAGDQTPWSRPTTVERWRKYRWKAGLGLALLALLPAGKWAGAFRTPTRPVAAAHATAEEAAGALPTVWLVEQRNQQEVYSNGLRVDTAYTVDNTPREYDAFPVGNEEPQKAEHRTWPAGIVYHTTESHLVSFSPEKTAQLQRYGEGLLRYVKGEKAYHYVIDRFGRVWRIVKESHAANHAGHSVWADGEATYINLNQSFLGVSVEAQTRGENGRPTTNPAQVTALRLVTEMLRSKYRLKSRNCVTHAQVSVSPASGLVSYHTDWALGFPFTEIGLPDNYSMPVPAMWVFGFSYDGTLMSLSGTPFWKGLLLGEDQLRQHASAHGLDIAAYRSLLRQKYRRVLESVKAANDSKQTEMYREKQG